MVVDESQIRKSKWATFWFEGVVAAYQNWESLVYRYLNATQRFEDNGDEESLKSFFNVDIGRSYIMQGRGSEIGAHELMERASSYPRGIIPHGGRFLIMAIDVQGENQTLVSLFRHKCLVKGCNVGSLTALKLS